MISHTDMREFIATLPLPEEDRAILEQYRSEQAERDESCDPVRTARLAEQRAFTATQQLATLQSDLNAAVKRIRALEGAVQDLPTIETVAEVISAMMPPEGSSTAS